MLKLHINFRAQDNSPRHERPLLLAPLPDLSDLHRILLDVGVERARGLCRFPGSGSLCELAMAGDRMRAWWLKVTMLYDQIIQGSRKRP